MCLEVAHQSYAHVRTALCKNCYHVPKHGGGQEETLICMSEKGNEDSTPPFKMECEHFLIKEEFNCLNQIVDVEMCRRRGSGFIQLCF